MKKIITFLFISALIISLGLIQIFPFSFFGNIKPNFILIILTLSLSFGVGFSEYLIFILLSLIILQWEPVFSKELFIFSAFMLLSFFLKDYYSFKKISSFSLFIIFSTSFLYFLLNPLFLISNPLTIFIETLANLFFGILIFILSRLFLKEYLNVF